MLHEGSYFEQACADVDKQIESSIPSTKDLELETVACWSGQIDMSKHLKFRRREWSNMVAIELGLPKAPKWEKPSCEL